MTKIQDLIKQAIKERENQPPSALKAKVFAQYPMVKITGNRIEGTLFGVMWYMDELFVYGKPTGETQTLPFSLNNTVALCLKPLEAITNEDAIDLAKIFKASLEYDKLLKFGHGVARDFLTHSAGDAHGKENIRMIDLLRERGYAMPYGKYSINELVEYGIYKLETP